MSISKKYRALLPAGILVGATAAGAMACQEQENSPKAQVTEAEKKPSRKKKVTPPPYFQGTWSGDGKLRAVDPQHPDLRWGKRDVAPEIEGDPSKEVSLTITIDGKGAVVGAMSVGEEEVKTAGVFLDDTARLALSSEHLRGVLVLHKEAEALQGRVQFSSVTDESARSTHFAYEGEFRVEKIP